MPSKLAPHFIGTPGFERWLSAGVQMMKFDPSSLGASNQVPQGILVVGKLDQDDEHLKLTNWKALMNQGKSPEEAAHMRFEAQRNIYTGKNKPRVDRYAVNGRIDVWEDDNEVVPDHVVEARWYATYCIEMMRHYESIGKKRANFSFATGTPEIKPGDPDDIWPHLLPAIRHARDNGHYVALHEYMGPYADLGVGHRQVDIHRQPKANAWHGRTDASGRPVESYPYGLCPLRYRWIVDEYLRPAGLADTRLIITECGCDGVDSITPIDMESGSWTSLRDGYWRDAGLDADSHYAGMLQWYDDRLREDPFVVGAAIFTVGSPGTGRWRDFDITGSGVEDRVLAHIAAVRTMPDQTVSGLNEPAKPTTSEVNDSAEAAGFVPSIEMANVPAGAAFEATWIFRNTGSSTWTGDYAFAYTDNAHVETNGFPRSTFGAPAVIALADLGIGAVAPGELVNITLSLVAPQDLGNTATNWQLRTPDGEAFGPIRWLRATVQ